MIPLFKVFVPPGICDRLAEVFASGILTEGRYSEDFESQLSEFLGNTNTAVVNSCTSAIVLALRQCGVGPGDSVISTPMTCMATNTPILNAGARIEWADIDPATGNVSPEDVRGLLKRLSPRPKAIVGVHWAGLPLDCGALEQLSREFGVPVIADAAHALGAAYQGRGVAAFCDYTCFSFQAIKHLTTGDGGAVACKRGSDCNEIKLLRWFGLDRKFQGSKWTQDITAAGYKFHMNNIAGCMGCEQMKHLATIVAAHKRHGALYDERIDNPRVTKLARPPGSDSAFWIYSLLVDDPPAFQKHMASCKVASDVVHVRNDRYSVMRAFATRELPGVTSFASRLMNIPVGWHLSEEDLNHVIEAVNGYRGA